MTAGPPTTYQLYDVSTSVTPDPTFTQPLPTQMTFMLQELPPPDLTSLQWPYPNLPGSLSLSEFSLGAASFIQLDDFATNTIGIGEFNPVPEPSTIALALTGLLAVLFKCLSSGRVRAGTTPSSIRSGALALCAPLAAGLAVPLLHRRRHSGR